MTGAPAWLEEAKSLRPLSYSKIAARLGVSRNQVFYWLKVKNAGEPLICAHCGEEFRPSARELNRRYCSRRCRSFAHPNSMLTSARQKNSLSKRGSRNPRWNGGSSGTPTPRRRERNRSVAKVRTAGFSITAKREVACRNCGSGGRLNLHHAFPRSLYTAGKTELLNGLPLCASCHANWHTRRTTIYRDVFTIEEWNWLSSQELTGQEISAWLDDHYPNRGRPFRQLALGTYGELETEAA